MIKSRIGIEVPSVQHFETIKVLYKKTAKQVVIVNETFSLLLSWIIFLSLLNILNDTWNGMTLIIGDKVSISGNIYSVPDHIKRIITRMLSALLSVIISKLILIMIVLIQLISVNNESKSTVVFLNDFVTQFKTEVSADTYYSVSYKLYNLSKIIKSSAEIKFSINLLFI